MRLATKWLALIAAAATCGCDGGTRCDYSGSSDRMVWAGCADGITREITCDVVTCHCRQNGASVSTFKPAGWPWSDKTAATRMANDACGWNVSRSTLPF